MTEIDLEELRFKAELQRDRRKWVVRRRLAIFSVALLTLTLIYFSTIGIFVDESAIKKISEFNSIIVCIVGAFTSVVLAYFGTLTIDEINKKAAN